MIEQEMREIWQAHYTELAWQGGDEALQQGWRHYVNGQLMELEKHHPGIREAVGQEIARRREAGKPSPVSDGTEGES